MMNVIKSDHQDIALIFQLYDEATAHQKKVTTQHWMGFERSMVEQVINEGLQYKIVIDEEIACIFTLAFHDPLIWAEKDNDPAVYIHRIATNPKFRGRNLVKHIVAWVKQYAIANGKAFIRLDTSSGNDKLNNYYISCGFNYLGVTQLSDATGLPAHYQNGAFSLFEIALT
jgi:ribosomal protein S18 acetylase RimI-like enzyme